MRARKLEGLGEKTFHASTDVDRPFLHAQQGHGSPTLRSYEGYTPTEIADASNDGAGVVEGRHALMFGVEIFLADVRLVMDMPCSLPGQSAGVLRILVLEDKPQAIGRANRIRDAPTPRETLGKDDRVSVRTRCDRNRMANVMATESRPVDAHVAVLTSLTRVARDEEMMRGEDLIALVSEMVCRAKRGG